MATFLETFECPKCHSHNTKWWLSASKQCQDCNEVFRSHELVDVGNYRLAYFHGDEVKEITLHYNGTSFVDNETGDIWDEAGLRFLPPRGSFGKLQKGVKIKESINYQI